MKELKLIVSSYEMLKSQGKKCALATVVSVEGSSYRRPGARMLIAEDGRLTGAISGGCLEGDALKKALLVINENCPSVVTYDTMDEEDAVIGVGLGCNGIIQILIEPINYENPTNAVELLKLATLTRENGLVVSMFSLKDRKAKLNGTWHYSNRHKAISINPEFDQYFTKTEEILNDGKSLWETQIIDSIEFTIFYEVIVPDIHLVILGAGNDVMPMVDMANILGWDITLADGRANYVTRERFPSSCQLVIAKPESVLEHTKIDARTVFALMTHNYNYDKAMLNILLAIDAVKYIALLGPKKKMNRIISEFQEEGKTYTAEQINKIYGPAGLNMGAETSEEIAISILSEIIAVMNEKNGMHLKQIQSKIH